MLIFLKLYCDGGSSRDKGKESEELTRIIRKISKVAKSQRERKRDAEN